MTIKILTEERETLKRICAIYGLECYVHEQELKSESTGLSLDYVNVTVEGIINHEHVWHLCRTFSIDLELQDAKSLKR